MSSINHVKPIPQVQNSFPPVKPKRREIDWAGLWFSFLAEYGEHPYIPYGYHQNEGLLVEWCELPHEQFDGVGGFVHLLREKGITFGELPLLQRKRVPSYFFTLKKFYGLDLSSHPATFHWDVNQIEPPYEIVSPRHFRFDEQTTVAITEAAQAGKVSVNSLLIYCLNRATLSLLREIPRRSRWMIPVNMRGSTGIQDITANQASCIPCEISSSDTIQDVHALVKTQFSENIHWHNWRLLNIGKILGRTLIKRLYHRQYHSGPAWTGAFSNLGSWTLEPEGSWYFTPPVTRGCPVGAGAITINGRLHLALQTHHGWKDNADHAQDILDRWVRLIAQETGRSCS